MSKLPLVSEKVVRSSVERMEREVQEIPDITNANYIALTIGRISKTNPHIANTLANFLVRLEQHDPVIAGAMIADFLYRTLNDQLEINELENWEVKDG